MTVFAQHRCLVKGLGALWLHGEGDPSLASPSHEPLFTQRVPVSASLGDQLVPTLDGEQSLLLIDSPILPFHTSLPFGISLDSYLELI